MSGPIDIEDFSDDGNDMPYLADHPADSEPRDNGYLGVCGPSAINLNPDSQEVCLIS